MKRRPAAILFLCALSGAFGGCLYPQPWIYVVALLLALLTMLVIRHNAVRISALLLFTIVLTAQAATMARIKFDAAVAGMPRDETIWHGVVEDVHKQENGLIELLLRARTASNPEQHYAIVAQLDEALMIETFMPGHRLMWKGRVHPNRGPLSPVLFDSLRFGLAHQIHGNTRISEIHQLFIGNVQSTPYFATTAKQLTDRIMAVVTPREASLLLAFIIGDTNLFSDEQTETYRNIGAEHLLAVSGLQVTLLAFLCFFLLTPLFNLLLPRSHAYRAKMIAGLITVAIIFWFVGLCGFSASSMRAFLMTTCLIVPNVVSRKIDAFDAFFASGLITILVMPTSAIDLGFLLSYAAVFGILLAHQQSSNARARIKKYSALYAHGFSLLVTTIAAFLATLPILCYHFAQISTFSMLTNLLLVPIATLLQMPAIILGLCGALWNMPLMIRWGSFFANVLEIIAEAINEFLGHITILPPLGPAVLALAALGILLIFFTILRPQKYLLIGGLILTFAPSTLSLIDSEKPFEATVIPVGQGDASLFSLPSGHHILVDAGGAVHGSFDPGEKIVLPTLRRKGIHELDVLVISHPDPDHILGVFAILDQINVKEIWHSGFATHHPLTVKLREAAEKKGIPIVAARDLMGSHLFGQTEVQILAPQSWGDEGYYPELSANDNSVVMRFVHQGQTFLWPGDLETFGEKLLLSTQVELQANFLKAPHHGSKTSSTPDFVKAVSPLHVIYSTGYENRFNFPHEDVRKRYQALGTVEWNTALHGEVTIRVFRNKISIDSYRRPFKDETRLITIAKNYRTTA